MIIRQSLWDQLVQSLSDDGGGRKESGAFLLGSIEDSVRIATSYVLYRALGAQSDRAKIKVPSEAYQRLWAICRERNNSVVADVHTHPGKAYQSETDMSYPMVPEIGHVALVIPNYAMRFRMDEVGYFVYEGNFNWSTDSADARITLT